MTLRAPATKVKGYTLFLSCRKIMHVEKSAFPVSDAGSGTEVRRRHRGRPTSDSGREACTRPSRRKTRLSSRDGDVQSCNPRNVKGLSSGSKSVFKPVQRGNP